MKEEIRIKVTNLCDVVNNIIEEWEGSEENRITIEELRYIRNDLKEIEENL